MEGLQEYGEAAVMSEGQEARYSQDKKMYVRFYTKAVRNNFKSNLENRPVFDNLEYVEIRIPGDRNSIYDQPVKQEHKMRFAEKYKFFKENEENIESGTPLSQWTYMNAGLVEELKYFGIRTVEQLAEMDDIHGQRFPNFNDMQTRAKLFLAKAEEGAQESKLAAELEQRDNKIEALEKQIQELANTSQKKTSTRGKAKQE